MGLLKKENLELAMKALTSLQGLVSFVMFIIALIIAADPLVATGIGHAPRNSGALTAVLSTVGMGSCFCGKFGARTHNKFCLLVYLALQVAISLLVLMFCATGSASSDLVPLEDQIRCSTSGYRSDCTSFLFDEHRDKLRQLWSELFSGAYGASSLQIMQTIQTEGMCCGFEPPYSCVSELFDGCGPEPFWFNATSGCDVVVERPTSTYYPGCPFSMPGGNCLAFNYSRGCVYHLSGFLRQRIDPLFAILTKLVCVPFTCAAIAAVLVIKRRDNDVLPTAYMQTKRPPQLNWDWD